MSPTITVSSFLRRIRSTFCSFVQQRQLELRTCKTYSKCQNLVQNRTIDVQNLENILKIPLWCFFTRIFFALCDFFEIFWIAPKGLLFVCFHVLQDNGCQKVPKGPPFYIFRHCDTVHKLILKFFPEFFKISQGSPFNFFYILQRTGVSQSPKCTPFTFLSLRYSADFNRSRLVIIELGSWISVMSLFRKATKK